MPQVLTREGCRRRLGGDPKSSSSASIASVGSRSPWRGAGRSLLDGHGACWLWPQPRRRRVRLRRCRGERQDHERQAGQAGHQGERRARQSRSPRKRFELH